MAGREVSDCLTEGKTRRKSDVESEQSVESKGVPGRPWKSKAQTMKKTLTDLTRLDTHQRRVTALGGLMVAGSILGAAVHGAIVKSYDRVYSSAPVQVTPKKPASATQEQIMAAVDEGEWFKNRFGEKCLKIADNDLGRELAASYGMKEKHMAWLGGNRGEIFNTIEEAEKASADHYGDGRHYTTLVGCQADD